MKDPHREELMTPVEAAVSLGVSLGWMERLIDGGVVRVVKVNGEVRVRAKDVRAYADVREQYRRERFGGASSEVSEDD